MARYSTWNTVYTSVCNVLLEPGGLQLGLLTVPQFLIYGGEVLVDLLSRSGIVKRIFIQPMMAGTATYSESEQMAHLENVVADGTHLLRTSEFYLDNTHPDWNTWINQPTTFNEDSQPIQQVNLVPNPSYTGPQITILQGLGGYGQFADTENPTEFDLGTAIMTPAGYGTFASFDGNPFVEVIGPGFGVMASAVSSEGNVEMLGTVLPSLFLTLNINNLIELLPDSFVPYLKYGVLEKIFGSDTELKDTTKEYYCHARLEEGILMAQAIMGGEIRDNG